MEKTELLDNRGKIKALDPQDALGITERFPEMPEEAAQLPHSQQLSRLKRPEQIVICGMGGSAISGDIAVDLLIGSCELPIVVNRSYQLPAFVDDKTLVFTLSYSGQTEETVSAAKQALAQGAKIAAITTDGKLKELAESGGHPVYLIPAGYQPRMALPFLLATLLRGLEELKLYPTLKDDLAEAIALLKRLRAEYGADKPARANPVKQLAKKLAGKVPLVFGCVGTTQAAALRFKTQFNENSKVTALANTFPELDHNELVNLGAVKRTEHNFSLICLRDEADSERIKKRIEITKSLIGRQLGGTIELASQGRSALARMLSLVYFGDLLSVYLALVKGIDPTEVEVIGRLKKEMAR
jgi:glucose/mannose-6-phosphate isomerase